MLSWLISLGFTLDQIEAYARNTDYDLSELMQNSDVQIENAIKKQILLDIYGDKLKLEFYLEGENYERD